MNYLQGAGRDQAGGYFFSSASVGRAHVLFIYSYTLWEFPETLLFHHRCGVWFP